MYLLFPFYANKDLWFGPFTVFTQYTFCGFDKIQ